MVSFFGEHFVGLVVVGFSLFGAVLGFASICDALAGPRPGEHPSRLDG